MRTMADQMSEVAIKLRGRKVKEARRIKKNRRIQIITEPCGCTVRLITPAELRNGMLADGRAIPMERVRMVEHGKGVTDPGLTVTVCDWHAKRPWWCDEYLKPQRKVEEAARDCRGRTQSWQR